MGYIYKISNDINNKVYIGQTQFTIEWRYKRHLECVKLSDLHLYKAMRKYGIEHFTVSKIEECEDSQLNCKEIYWIAFFDSFHNGYNMTIGGDGRNSKSLLLLTSVDSVINSYMEGATLKELAIKYNTDKMTVRRYLVKWGVPIRHKSFILKCPENIKFLISDFLSGMTWKNLEQKYHADTRTLKRILLDNNIDINQYRGLRQTRKGSFCLNEKQCCKVIDMYNNPSVKLVDILDYFKVDATTIYKVLDKYNIDRRYNTSKSVQSLKSLDQG